MIFWNLYFLIIFRGISFFSEDVQLKLTMVNFPLPMETASRSGLAAVEALVWLRNGVGLTMVAAIFLPLWKLMGYWSSVELWILSGLMVCYGVAELEVWWKMWGEFLRWRSLGVSLGQWECSKGFWTSSSSYHHIQLLSSHLARSRVFWMHFCHVSLPTVAR